MTKSTKSKTPEYDAVVIGAGIAGLTFAWEYSKLGHKVLVLEKESQVGGLHRTVWFKGHGFDFSAHRFHSANPHVLAKVRQLMGKQFSKKQKKSRIFMYDRFLKYPFDIDELLLAMPPSQAIRAILGFLQARINRSISPNTDLSSYKDWSKYYFGLPLYQAIVEPYTSKLWRTDPAKISADWANQRFQTVKVTQIISQFFQRLIKLQLQPSTLEEDLYPDSGDFYYAKTGAQAIPDTLAQAVKQNHSQIKTSVNVTKITPFKHHARINYSIQNKHFTVKARHVVTTIPLQSSLSLLNPNPPLAIKRAINKTKYLSIIFINAIINKTRVSRDTWLYFPTQDIIFNRAVEFKNWSSIMAPKRHQTGICFDITCFPHDKIFNQSDESLITKLKKSASKAKLFQQKQLDSYQIIRLKHAYPFYDLHYKSRLKKVVNFIEKSGRVFCLGRTGIARYNNADGSVEMGLELARRLHHQHPNPSLLDYSFNQVSL